MDDLNSVTATLGNDMYIGGENIDFISYLHIDPGLKLRRDGDERIVEKANGDTDQLQGFEQLFGTEGNDKLKPGLGNDSSAIYGHSGSDAIGGGRKADLLDGGAGNGPVIRAAAVTTYLSAALATMFSGGMVATMSCSVVTVHCTRSAPRTTR